MTEGFTIQLPKVTEKKLLARYDNMLQKAIEKALSNGNVKACPTWSLTE